VRQWLEGQSPLPENADHADHCFWCATRERRLEGGPSRKNVRPIREGSHQLDILNRRLSGYSFVGKRNSFKHSVSPDFKPLYDLVLRDNLGSSARTT
jgi:hypothetical protein